MSSRQLSIFLLVVLAISHATEATTLFDEEIRVADKILGENPKDNLKYIRPPGEPTNVTVNMYVRKIFSVDPESRIWKVQLTFRQEWVDTRLAYTTTHVDMKYLPYGQVKDIWTPDLFFRDEVDSDDHHMLKPNDLLRIFPDGHVLYSTRITLKMYCPGDFHKKDVKCPMDIASYMYTKDEINIQWSAEDPVQLNKNLVIPDYTLSGVTTHTCESETKLGKWSCIRSEFTFGHDVCKA